MRTTSAGGPRPAQPAPSRRLAGPGRVHRRSPRSTPTASSPAPTARSATCASATASSASCAGRRSATGPWPRPRRTSSSPPTPRAATRSSRTAPRRCSAGTWPHASVDRSSTTWRPAGGGRRQRATRRCSPTRRPSTARRIDFLDGDGRPRPARDQRRRQVRGRRSSSAINGVARDISERDRLERELSRSEERYRFLVEKSPDIVFATDAEGRFTFLSEAIERMTGYRPRRARRRALLGPRRPVELPGGGRALG